MDGNLVVLFREYDGERSFYVLVDDDRAEQWRKLGVGNYDMDRVLVRPELKPRHEDWITIKLKL